MGKMVRDLRRTRIALGDGIKRVYESERDPMFKMGKALYAARNLPAGHVLTPEDVVIKSPAAGLPPFELERVIGRRLLVPLHEEDGITWDVLDGSLA